MSSSSRALMAAADSGHAQCVELLLEAGAFAVQEDNLGNTALHHAAWAGDLVCLDKLLEHRQHCALLVTGCVRVVGWDRKARVDSVGT